MIPVVDISGGHTGSSFAATVAQMSDAWTAVGFVAITGHGVTPSLLGSMRQVVEDVFALSDDMKTANMIEPANYRGFIPLGFFTPNRPDTEDSETVEADRYEGFKLHWESPPGHPAANECDLYGPNRWLENVPEMRPVVLAYWEACDRVSGTLLRIFAQTLGLDTDEFLAMFDAPMTNMTLLHYPPQDPEDESPSFHPHKDTNAFTILFPDPVGGLRLQKRDGSWIDAECPADALLINIGDMMELWSGGRFVSTPHQVINTTGAERYSFPHFVVPTHSAVVKPLVEPLPGFDRTEPVPVGHWSAEVWRTNWPDQQPGDDSLHLGSLARTTIP